MVYVVRFSPRMWWLHSVYVHPDHRRKGHFKAILKFIVERAKLEHIKQIKLEIATKDSFSKEGYIKLGF